MSKVNSNASFMKWCTLDKYISKQLKIHEKNPTNNPTGCAVNRKRWAKAFTSKHQQGGPREVRRRGRPASGRESETSGSGSRASVGIPSRRAPARSQGAEHIVLCAGAKGAASRPVSSAGPVRRARQRRALVPSWGRRRKKGAVRDVRPFRPERQLLFLPDGAAIGSRPAVLPRRTADAGRLLLLLLPRPVGHGAVRAHARAPFLVEVGVVLRRHAALVPLVVIAAGAVGRRLPSVRGAAVAGLRGGALPWRPALIAGLPLGAAPSSDGECGGRGLGVAPFLAGWQKGLGYVLQSASKLYRCHVTLNQLQGLLNKSAPF